MSIPEQTTPEGTGGKGGAAQNADGRVVPVVIAADDNYAENMAVCLYSIMQHTRSRLDVYVLDGGITEGNKAKIAASLECFQGHCMTYVDMAAYDLARFPSVCHFGITAFARYFIPEICAKHDKVVYTDSDIIFMHDIAELYDLDLEGYGIAAAPEQIGSMLKAEMSHAARKETFGIPQSHRYFNNGLLVMDCEWLRQNGFTEKCVQKTIELYDKLVCPDMDVMNIFFAGGYKQLDVKFNCLVFREEKECGDQEMIQSFRKPFAIHYAGDVKPWKTADVAFSDVYDTVLSKTCFKGRRAPGGKWRHLRYLCKKMVRQLSAMHIRLTTDTGEADGLELVDTGELLASYWNDEPGGGQVFCASTQGGYAELRAKKPVTVRLAFGATPLGEGESRTLLRTVYNSIRINGKELLAESYEATADAPYCCELQVRPGESVRIEVGQEMPRYCGGWKKIDR